MMRPKSAVPAVAWTDPETDSGSYPVRFDVSPQTQHGRLSVLFRPLLVLPYAIVAYAIAYLVYPLTVLAWFAIVFAGRYPRGLWGFCANLMIWRARFYTYAGLLRDEYPPFSYAPYPAVLQIDYARRRSRVRTFFRAILLLPQLFASYLIYIAWYACLLLAWVAILITGTYPEGIRRFMIGAIRWLVRLEAYMLLLVDDYPPFSLGLQEPALETTPSLAPRDTSDTTLASDDFVDSSPASQDVVDSSPTSDVDGDAGEVAFHPFPERMQDDLRPPPGWPPASPS